MDRHNVWRRAQTDYEAVKNRAGQGYEAFVQAWIAGRPDPVPLGFVTTRRGRDEVWIRLESETLTARDDDGDDDVTIPAECFWLYVHENALLAVEVGFRRSSGAPCGFGYVEESGYVEEPG